MRDAKLGQKYVSLMEALTWIAFRTCMDVADTKVRLRSDPAVRSALEAAMQQFSVAACDGHLKARGRNFASIGGNGMPQAGDTVDIPQYSFKDYQQFDLDLHRLQRLPAKGSRVLELTGIWTVAHAPDGAAQLTKGYAATEDESFARAFQSLAGSRTVEGASLSDGYVDVEVEKAGLVTTFPPPSKLSKARGRPRTFDHDAARARAKELREQEPGISLTSAAASLAIEFGLRRKSMKPYNPRGMERVIAPLWQSEETK